MLYSICNRLLQLIPAQNGQGSQQGEWQSYFHFWTYYGILSSMFKRRFGDPGGSYFLFGPRGTGKSTWLRETYPKAVIIDLLQPDVFRSYAARPERLRERVHGALVRWS